MDAKPKDTTASKGLNEKKFELIAKAREIKAEIAKINAELVKQGHPIHEVACW